jgi:hypothetical protein
MATSSYRVEVFGKAGCDKCGTLNQRLDKLLEKPEWADFEKQYWDLETEEGLVAFCEAECINPQRVPALLLSRRNEATGEYEPVSVPPSTAHDPVCGHSRLYQYLGLQTDYSEEGRGVITPKMIAAVLSQARA